jgi:MFS family permease
MKGTSISFSEEFLPPRQARNVRRAVTLLFVTNGALLANVLPRYPEIKEALGLTYLDFGAAVAAFPVGAIVFGLLASVGVRRFGSARLAVIATALLSIGLLGAGISSSWIWLAAALFFAGAMDTIADVAQNAQGLRLQKLLGTSILNSFHAGWSVGAVLGGAMGAVAVAFSIPIGLHLALSGIFFTALTLLAFRFMLPSPENLPKLLPAELPSASAEVKANAGATVPHPAATIRPAAAPHRTTAAKWIPVAILAFMAMGGMIVEDAGLTWSTLYLKNDITASASLVGLGLIAFLVAQFAGRLTGDALINRLGQRFVTRFGAAIILAGMVPALVFPSAAASIIGFTAAGWGIATIIPAAMHAANELPGFRAGTGLTLVTWLMRIGAFSSPLIVGAVADQVGLRAGLLFVPLVGLILLVLAPIFEKRR